MHTFFSLNLTEIPYSLLDLLSPLNPVAAVQAVIDLTERLSPNKKGGRLWLLPSVVEPEKLRDVTESGRDLTTLLGHAICEVDDIFAPDLILIDSRSGFTELASAAVIKADRLVCVLRPNRQNVEGIRMLLDITNTLGVRPETFSILSHASGSPDEFSAIRRLLGASPGGSPSLALPYLPELCFVEDVFSSRAQDSALGELLEPLVAWLEGDGR